MTLPHFLIVGAQKAGTSTLFYALAEHPKFAAPVDKELQFFGSARWFKGVDLYESYFPALEDGQVTGEASPWYLAHPKAAVRASKIVPDAKIVILLRNPVDRAYSDYQHTARQGKEPLSFEDALEAEPERIAGEFERMRQDGRYNGDNYRRYAYLARGIYLPQIRRWQKRFDDTLILSSGDLYEAPRQTCERVAKFVGLSAGGIKEPEVKNRGEYEPMKADTRQMLENHFAPHNQRLYEYLNRDFGW